MSPMTPKEFDAAARQSFYVFVERAFQVIEPGREYLYNWHIEAICRALEDLYEGKNLRLIVNIYPRSLKSFIASVCFPAWVLGHNPAAKFMCVSYGEALAKDLSLKTKLLMESKLYARLFPNTKISDVEDTAVKFSTTAQGGRQAITIAGGHTGFGADYLIIDDPIKATDAQSAHALIETTKAFGGGLLTRLNNPKEGAIAVIMQRLHEADLTGFLLEQDGWKHVRIPAVAEQLEEYALYDGKFTRPPKDVLQPAFLGEAELAERRKILGSAVFEAQYQQNPMAPGGNLFQLDQFRFYAQCPRKDFVFQNYDTALTESATADYSVCQTWVVSDGKYYLHDMDRFRCNYLDLLARAVHLEAKHKPDTILCELTGGGKPFAEELHARFRPRVFGITPRESKLVRALSVLPTLERGEVLLPRSAAWFKDFWSECLSFPNGRHDDQVDCMVQFLMMASYLSARVKNLGLSQQLRRNSGSGSTPPVAPAATPMRRRMRSIYGLERDVLDSFR